MAKDRAVDRLRAKEEAMPGMPTPPEIMRRTALWLIEHPITYESLSNGPLGEALTRAQIEELADNPEAILNLLYGIIDAELGRLREIERVFRDGYLPAIPGEGETLKLRSLVHLRMLIGVTDASPT